jgi:hypothetical protein
MSLVTWIESCSICKSVHLNSGGPIRRSNVLNVFVSYVDNNMTSHNGSPVKGRKCCNPPPRRNDTLTVIVA